MCLHPPRFAKRLALESSMDTEDACALRSLDDGVSSMDVCRLLMFSVKDRTSTSPFEVSSKDM